VLNNITAFGSNRLLNLLTDNCRQNLLTHCELVSINLGEVLCNPGDVIKYVYFPVEGIVSWEKKITDSPYWVVTLIGNEGMICISLLLGINERSCRAVVQKSGFALRIAATIFTQQVEQKPAISLVLNRYANVMYNQSLQIAACNLFHVIENRLARLLLMFQQRSQSEEINITQDQLAKMLGVRRVGVTKAAGSLQRKNLISYIRGSVIIHDIAGLKKASCSCYEADNATYNNMM
jgi:CRP-like cAMP-binding protein